MEVASGGSCRREHQRLAHPVLLRVDFDAGHGIGSTRSQLDALVTDIHAFVLWRAGAERFQPR